MNHFNKAFRASSHPRETHSFDSQNHWAQNLRFWPLHENHFGKGPRGYRRSQERIRDEVCQILAQDFFLDASGLEVELDDHVLILKGEVDSRRDKRRAEDLVADVPGVEDVQNQLRVKRAPVEGWIPGLGRIDDTLGG